MQNLNYNDKSISESVLNDSKLFKTSSCKSNTIYNVDIIDFLRSRKSTRFFIDKVPDRQSILNCISISQRSPSACNRQSARYFYTVNHDKITEILSLQTGNRGFGTNIPALIIVTSSCSDLLLQKKYINRS